MRLFLLVLMVAGCDRGSSCKDVVVAAQTTLGLDRSEAEKMVGRCELTPWTAKERSCVRAAGSVASLVACGQDLTTVTYVAQELAKMSEFTGEMCACKTAECAERVADNMTRSSQEMAKIHRDPPRMTEDETRRATELGDKLGKCMQVAMLPSANPPPTRR